MKWRVFLACRCRLCEQGCDRTAQLRPGLTFDCPEHGEQRIISAKVIDSSHAWTQERPFTGWLVCIRCGERHSNTHDGRYVHYTGRLECGCPKEGQLPEKFLYQYGVWCQTHETRRWRHLETIVVDPRWCSCGRCMDERAAQNDRNV